MSKITDAELDTIEDTWKAALAHDMRHGSVSGIPPNLDGHNAVMRLLAEVREARALVAGLAQTHNNVEAVREARKTLVAWRGEEGSDAS